MNIVLFGRGINNGEESPILNFAKECAKHGDKVYVSHGLFDKVKYKNKLPLDLVEPFDGELPEVEIQLLVSIGGDGTFLRAARLADGKKIPIAGINTGRLGFLAETALSDLIALYTEFREGKCKIESRPQLELTTSDQISLERSLALNEIAILRKDTSSLIVTHVYVDGQLLNSYWADGLIVSTPTGSTAYSMSAGGPIMVPNSDSIALTPIAPHSLTTRPIVLPLNVEIKMIVESRSRHYMVSIDTNSEFFSTSTELCIKKAKQNVLIVQRENYDFYATLRKKLMWGQDIRKSNH